MSPPDFGDFGVVCLFIQMRTFFHVSSLSLCPPPPFFLLVREVGDVRW